MNAPANFDRLAKVYRWMEYFSFGKVLERCRFFFLDRCANARRALVLGDGDGRFTQRLMQQNSTVEIDAADASPRMLQALRERVDALGPQPSARLRTLHCDLRTYTPESRGYDLVVSHFFLDCLTDDDVSALVERLLPALTEDAIWVVSEFSIPKKGLRRAAARLAVRSLYFVFFVLARLRVDRIPDYAKAFRDRGFHRREDAEYLGGILTAELWKRRTD